MRSRVVFAISLALTWGLIGCAHAYKSDWQSLVVAAKENPRNGTYNTGQIRAEVVKYRCGILYRLCTTVQLVDETEFIDVFTYIGSPNNTSVAWIDSHHLQITCNCTTHTIELKRQDAGYTDNIYIAYRI